MGEMKDINRILLKKLMVKGETAKQCVSRLECLLDAFFEDSTLSIHDKVAGDFDFEELLVALEMARSLLEELEH